MLINKANLDAIFYQFSTIFQTAYEDQPNWWQEVATLAPSAARESHYGWIGRLPALRKWLGERQFKNLQARGYVLVNEKYEDGIAVPRDQIEDDQIGVFANYLDGLGRAAKIWPDQVVAAAMQAGVTALCFDGQPFFHNAHPVDMDVSGGSTFQNNFDNTATGGNTTRPLNPANYFVVRSAMMSYVGEDGVPLGIVPDLLMVPPQLEASALQLVQADLIAPSVAVGSNAASVVASSVTKGQVRLMVNPYLANDATSWYLLDTKRAIKPFIWQLRDAPEFQFLNKPDDPNVVMRDEYLFGVRARGAAGYTLPFLCARASA